MGWFKGQFIDIIQWEDKNPDHLVWRFERHNAEIKSGAKLIVNPGEAAIFVNKGKPEHVFYEPGTYELSTSNYPFLSTILGLPYGLESPHKAYVYFVSQALFLGMKWGTKGKIDFNDADLGPVSIGAYGTYDFCVKIFPVISIKFSHLSFWFFNRYSTITTYFSRQKLFM